MNSKKLQTIALLFLSYLAISGIYTEFNKNILYFTKSLFPVSLIDHININFLVFDTDFSIANYTSFSLLNIAFYLFLVIALLYYFISKGIERKLLLFLTSFLFINTIIVFIIHTIERLASEKPFFNPEFLFHQIAYLIITILKIVALYFTIKILTPESEYIESEIKENKPVVEEKLSAREILNASINKKNIFHFKYEKSSKGIRFTNFVIDNILIVLIVSNYTYLVKAYGRLNRDELFFYNVFGEDLTLPFLLFLYSFCYYLICEFLFKKSPAKFLTNSSVLKTDCEKAGFGDFLVRSLCRRIPFDSFSFFGTIGWHDSLSNTNVFNEKNSSWKSSSSILTLLIGILLVGAFFIFKDSFEKMAERKIETAIELKKEDNVAQKINAITQNDFIFLTNMNEYGNSNGTTVFKVENISNEALTGTIFDLSSVNNSSILDYYLKSKDSLPRKQINKQQLLKSVNNVDGESLFNDSSNYIYDGIYDLSKPCLMATKFDFSSDILFENIGKPCTIIAVDNDFYTSDEVAKPPVKLNTTRFSEYDSQHAIKLFDRVTNGNFKIKIHLEDENKKKYTLLFTNLNHKNYTLDIVE